MNQYLNPEWLKETADDQLHKRVDEFIRSKVVPSVKLSAEKGYRAWETRMGGDQVSDEHKIMFGHPDFEKVIREKLDGFDVKVDRREFKTIFTYVHHYLVISW